MKIDAIAYWPPTDRAYFFRGKSYVKYRMSADANHQTEGAEELFQLAQGNWKDLKFDGDIDAVATVGGPTKDTGVLYFFKGEKVVTYDIKTDHALHDPKPVAEVFPNLPAGFEGKFDTVLFWPVNKKMYFFKGNGYIRYNLGDRRPENTEPNEISKYWNGLAFVDIDASLVGNRGKAYFFKGDQYIKYAVQTDDRAMGPPLPIDPPPPKKSNWPGLTDMLGGAEETSGTETPARPEREVYDDVKSYYTMRAKHRAHVEENGQWNPEDGFPANRKLIVGVYDYYRDLHVETPARFFWAGLGRMAGGAVVGGLDSDPGVGDPEIQKTMVRIGKEIFHDLAWQHEAYLAEGNKILEYAAMHDRYVEYATYSGDVLAHAHAAPRKSYRDAWEKILSDDGARIAEGNRDLLENEQWSIIQPHYDHIRPLMGAGFARPMADNIHPYHRPFIFDMQAGEVLVASDRWKWITLERGMWEHWMAAGQEERLRLVKLDFELLCQKRLDPIGRPDLIIGAP